MKDLNFENKLTHCWKNMEAAAYQCDWSAMRRAYWQMYWLRRKHEELMNAGELVIDENNNSLNV